MITDTSERVQQAVVEGYKLLATVVEAKKVLLLAKQSEDAVREGKTSRDLQKAKANAEEAKVGALDRVETAHKQATKKAEDILERATVRYHESLATVNQDKIKGEEDADQVCADIIKEAQQKRDLAMAEVKAVVYRAGREISALEATIRQHTKTVKDSLGIDLSTILGVR